MRADVFPLLPMRKQFSLDYYRFPALVEEMFGCPLAHMHELPAVQEAVGTGLLKPREDQRLSYYQRFYEPVGERCRTTLGGTFVRLYREFVREAARWIQNVPRAKTPAPMIYQAIPTLRIQLPGNLAVGELHRDADYGHPPTEITCWVPLTPVEATNAIWVPRLTIKDNAQGIEDLMPLKAQPGEALLLNTATQLHGNMVSEATTTRVSFDFRLLFREDYAALRANGVPAPRSESRGLRFEVGDYYADAWD